MEDLFRFGALERRAAKHIYYTFRVNRFELYLLYSMATFLGLFGRKAMTQRQIFDHITGNMRAKRQLAGYWQGLLRTECIREVELHGGRKSYYISELGMKVLQSFEVHYKTLEASMIKKGRADYDISKLVPKDVKDLGSNQYKTLK
jgi:hypothetical protein